MTKIRHALIWEYLGSLSDIEIPLTGKALIAIGMDRCEPCEIIAAQISAFSSKYKDTTVKLYKFTTFGRSSAEVDLLGQQLRFFPTVLGFYEGVLAFRMQGVLANAKRFDIIRLEKGFARFAAGNIE